ncbi:MAG: beta-lactamase family protein [Planctomycetaceae bacterium]|nr:beta-lactamase family protein [Planctomycetaceae bacterium]
MNSLSQVLPRTADLIAADFAAGQHKGFQLYVSLRGETVANVASGEASPGVPMTPETLVCWLSSGKPLTAVAIGLLWQRGKLALDDRVAKYIPEFAQGGKDEVTIRHILTHTGGFPNADAGYPQNPWNESLAAICAAPLESDWIVGRTGGYHVSASWFVLGEVIQRVTGQTFETFLRGELCEPLGMHDARLAVSPTEAEGLGDRLGWTWRRAGKTLEPLDWHQPPRLDHPSPGSGARGPIHELGRFYEGLLAALQGKSDLVLPHTVEAMTARHRAGETDRTFQHVVDFGLGFLVDSNRYGADTIPYSFGKHCSPRTFGHGGAQSSMGFADPEHSLVVAWATNALIGEPRHNTRNRAINTAIYEDLGLG